MLFCSLFLLSPASPGQHVLAQSFILGGGVELCSALELFVQD